MSSVRLMQLLSVVAVTVVTLGAAGTASAAPGSRFERGEHAAPTMVRNVHWEWFHHHRHWVPDHADHHRYR